MKKSELKKMIQEEIKSTIKEMGEGVDYKAKIEKSVGNIEDYLYHMPSVDFAKVMKQWLKYYNEYDQETLDMFNKLERSLWKFDDLLNFDGNPIPHSAYGNTGIIYPNR